MEEIKNEIKSEKVVSSEQPNDIDSLKQQIALLQTQLQQKVETKKVTLNGELMKLQDKKTELTTQLNNIQLQIDNIKKELGINDVVNDSDKKAKRTRKTDGNTVTVKQYYAINGDGKYTAYEIAKEYGIFECYFVKDQNGKTIKKLYANWNRFLPLILNGKTGEGYGELEDKSYRISPSLCDKIRQEVKAIDNTVTTDNSNANTNTQQNANSDNTNANKELLDQLPKNPITDNANSNTQNNATDNATTDNNTTQQ